MRLPLYGHDRGQEQSRLLSLLSHNRPDIVLAFGRVIALARYLQVISKFEFVTLSAAKSPLLPVCKVGIPPRRFVGMTFLR
jgi:hypothetical protein